MNLSSYVQRLLKGYEGLGSKFLNGGQNFTINAEKIADHFCHKRFRELISEKKCKPLRQSRLHRTDLQLRSSYAVTLNPCKVRITVTQNHQFVRFKKKTIFP